MKDIIQFINEETCNIKCHNASEMPEINSEVIYYSGKLNDENNKDNASKWGILTVYDKDWKKGLYITKWWYVNELPMN